MTTSHQDSHPVGLQTHAILVTSELFAFLCVLFSDKGTTFGQKGTAFDLRSCLCRQKIKVPHPTRRYSIWLCFDTQRARRASRAAPSVCRSTEACCTFLSDTVPLFFVGTGNCTGQMRYLFGQMSYLCPKTVAIDLLGRESDVIMSGAHWFCSLRLRHRSPHFADSSYIGT